MKGDHPAMGRPKTATQKNQRNKNVHGRVGVKRPKLRVVLTKEQLQGAYQEGWAEGHEAGVEYGAAEAIRLAEAIMTKRNVKDAKGLAERFLATGSIDAKPRKRSLT